MKGKDDALFMKVANNKGFGKTLKFWRKKMHEV